MPTENSALPESDTATPTDERRAWVRYPANLESGCQPVAMPTAPQPEWRWPATVKDISAGGIALVLERRFECGAALHVELQGAAEDGVHSLTAHVVHIQMLGNRWLLGCEWTAPLADEELDVYRHGAVGIDGTTCAK